jgi:hypothetical protein
MLASRGGTDALPELVAERILPALNVCFVFSRLGVDVCV